VTNLLFIGSPEQVRRAFQAAGWVPADRLTAGSTFETLKSISGTTVYNEAPMSTLLLDERPPLFTFSKTTNTFSSRHHLRIFDPDMRYNGQPVLTASSTQDIGIAFSAKKKTFIHVIDQYIDNERSKVVNDLTFTGCVTAMDMATRSWVPQDAYNSTGDRLRTDGAIAVLQFNDCSNPRKTPTEVPDPPSRFERIVRDTMLTLRNDLWRGNLGYQGVTGAIKAREYLVSRDVLKPSEGAWQTTDLSGTEFEGVGTMSEERQPSVRMEDETDDTQPNAGQAGGAAASHRWDAPRYEIAVQGGYLRYPSIRSDVVGVVLTPEQVGSDRPVYGVVLADQVDGGWTAGISFTANTWRWVSNEFSYQYQRGKYQFGTFQFDENTEPEPDTQQVGLVTRQFEYNVLVHARPRESRWRPYVAAGPVLQLLSLTDAPIKRAAGPFKLGFQNVGILKAAFDFGSTPPLEGGGIFQLGLQYGAGIKFRVHPRITLRADFRETWSKNPEFIRDSYTDDYFDVQGYNSDYFRAGSRSKFRQQRFTFGVGFTF
jgi:opacity protein-like surface antigen